MKRIQLGFFGVLVAGQLLAQSRHAIVAERALDFTLPGQSELREVTDTLVPFGFASGIAVMTVGVEDGGGFVFGTNGYGDERKAQQYDITGPVNVEGMLALVVAKNGTGSVTFSVMDDDAVIVVYDQDENPIELPAPGTSLSDVTLTLAQIDTTDLTAVTFASPITVNERFFLAADFTSVAATYPASWIGFASSEAGADGTSIVGSWEYYGGEWSPVAMAWGEMFDVALLAVIDAGSVGVNSLERVNGMQMSLIGGNPATDVVQMAYDFERAANGRMMVMDITGARVVDQELGRVAAGEHRTAFDVSGWANGTYFVTVMADGRPITKKLVVQH